MATEFTSRYSEEKKEGRNRVKLPRSSLSIRDLIGVDRESRRARLFVTNAPYSDLSLLGISECPPFLVPPIRRQKIRSALVFARIHKWGKGVRRFRLLRSGENGMRWLRMMGLNPNCIGEGVELIFVSRRAPRRGHVPRKEVESPKRAGNPQ